MQRVLFARIGWMEFYAGSRPGDERPSEYGQYHYDFLGHELHNFEPQRDHRLRGFFRSGKTEGKIDLRRIDHSLEGGEDSIDRVLLIFFAPEPQGEVKIIGWYCNAKVFSGYRAGLAGERSGFPFNCQTQLDNAVLIPVRKRTFTIDASTREGIGLSNHLFMLDSRGNRIPGRPWMEEAIEWVNGYSGPNLLSRRSEDNPNSGNARSRRLRLVSDVEESQYRDVVADLNTDELSTRGQGYQVNPLRRKAVEKYAVKKAIDHYGNLWETVDDVGIYEPYDLHCSSADGGVLRVEVKGTTGSGDKVHLTANEVKNARENAPYVALFVVHSIRVEEEGDEFTASGGEVIRYDPFEVDDERLTATTYSYRLIQ